METFRIKDIVYVSKAAIKAFETQFQLTLDETCTFLSRNTTLDTFFFSRKLYHLYFWNGELWTISNYFSTKVYIEQFNDLIDERNNKSKTLSEPLTTKPNESFTLDKMLATLTEETWKEFSPSEKARIIVQLLSK